MPDKKPNPIDAVLSSNPIDAVLSAKPAETKQEMAPGSFQTQPGGQVYNANQLGSQAIQYPSFAAGVSGSKARTQLPDFPQQVAQEHRENIGTKQDLKQGALNTIPLIMGAAGTLAGPGGMTLGAGAGTEIKQLLQGKDTLSAGGLIDLAGSMGTTGAMEAAPAIGRGVQSGVDRLAGVPKAISKAYEERAAAEAEQELAKSANIARARSAEQATAQEQAAVKAKNIAGYRQAEQELAQTNERISAENKVAQEQYKAELRAARTTEERNKLLVTRQQMLSKSVEDSQLGLKQHLDDVSQKVFADLDKRWDTVRQAVGTKITANPATFAVAKGNALRTISKPNEGLFNAILKDAFGEAKGALNWADTQAIYTKLGDRLAAGDLPGDVYRGLRAYQKEIGAEMENMAQAAGVRPQFTSVKADWGQAMEDLRDTSTAVAKGGSPLAHALKSADAANVAKTFEGPLRTGPSGRALRTLARYRSYGADPYLPLKYRRIQEQLEALPKPAKVSVGEAPIDKPLKEMTSAKYTPPPASPTSSPYSPLPKVPDVNEGAIRAQQRGQLGGRALKYGLGAGLLEEIVRRFMSGGTNAPHP